METYDLTTHPAASSTTPTSSADRIVREFIAQGAPNSPSNVVEGEILGGFQIRTPKVGDGFIEWAINGYDLEGKIKNPPAGVNYDKHGDWLFDKTAHNLPDGGHRETEFYNDNYIEDGLATVVHDKTRKEK